MNRDSNGQVGWRKKAQMTGRSRMESADKTSSRGCGRKTWNGVNERQEERREEE